MTDETQIVVTVESPPDRERLVSSIMIDHAQMTEINQESDELMVELYPRDDGKPWVLKFSDLVASLAKARERLGQ